MHLLTFGQIKDYSDKRVMIPISGGINSAAILCFLIKYLPDEWKPKYLYLYYTHLDEHSPQTLRFVRDLFLTAKNHFPCVETGFNRASVNDYFVSQNMIPHPSISPCSKQLKIEPQQAQAIIHNIDIQLVGYVKSEMRRYRRALKYENKNVVPVDFPILESSDDDCFDIVKDVLGWYPYIYDILWERKHFDFGLCEEKQIGKRVFKHNNCLPCKNMRSEDFKAVAYFFPQFAKRAIETQNKIPNAYWGRDDVADIFVCDVCQRNG